MPASNSARALGFESGQMGNTNQGLEPIGMTLKRSVHYLVGLVVVCRGIRNFVNTIDKS
jgi:hypothetical protein